MIVEKMRKWKERLLELQGQLIIERNELPALKERVQADSRALREAIHPLQEGERMEARVNEIVAEFPET